jgi:hypothetical protein
MDQLGQQSISQIDFLVRDENMTTKSNSRVRNSALSVRQPFASMIICGIKSIEFRSQPTSKLERVYIYASKSPVLEEYESLGIKPGSLPSGVLIGTVEIIDCTGKPGHYEWHLANPKPLKKPIKPDNQAMPTWFIPFKKQK